MPKTKSGEVISWKEFFKRWKQGLNEVTPLQQVKIQFKSTFIIIAGLIAGIVISSLNFKLLWWLILILIGGLFNTLIQLLGLYQKKNAYQHAQDTLDSLNEEMDEEVDKEFSKIFRNKTKEEQGK